QVLHYAVLNRAPEMARLLMKCGANAREGVYPHREATSALAIATERGYDEIVAIIEAAERRRREETSGRDAAPAPDELFRAILSDDDERAIALLEADPALIHTCSSDGWTPQYVAGWTPLHMAASRLNQGLVAWLLDHGADV